MLLTCNTGKKTIRKKKINMHMEGINQTHDNYKKGNDKEKYLANVSRMTNCYGTK
jgi:hypothetical protein